MSAFTTEWTLVARTGIVGSVNGKGEHSVNVTVFTLEVDGEQFAIREAKDRVPGYTDTGYTWLTGPNEGYGFDVQGPGRPSLEDHRGRLRDFLSMVDPATGFMKEDW